MMAWLEMNSYVAAVSHFVGKASLYHKQIIESLHLVIFCSVKRFNPILIVANKQYNSSEIARSSNDTNGFSDIFFKG